MSWLTKLFGKDPANDWNTKGRAHFAGSSDAIMNHFCFGDPITLGDDPRTPEAASAVLDEVMRLNHKGQWQKARQRFDPAHEPFVPMLDERGQNLSCVTIVGPDACVVRLDKNYQDSETLLIRDGAVTPLSDVLAITASRNHDWLVVVTGDGFHQRTQLDAPDSGVLPWPCDVSRLDKLCLSDNGQRVLFGHSDYGVFAGDFALGRWVKIHPNDTYLAELREESHLDEAYWSGAMLHYDLSPDGQYIAYGDQCHGHMVVRLDADLKTEHWCTVGPDIAYPHYACFAGDSRHLALNGCHFYSGVTLGVDVPASRGLDKPDYQADVRAPVIEHMLRVYAATWLPPEALAWRDTGAKPAPLSWRVGAT